MGTSSTLPPWCWPSTVGGAVQLLHLPLVAVGQVVVATAWRRFHWWFHQVDRNGWLDGWMDGQRQRDRQTDTVDRYLEAIDKAISR